MWQFFAIKMLIISPLSSFTHQSVRICAWLSKEAQRCSFIWSLDQSPLSWLITHSSVWTHLPYSAHIIYILCISSGGLLVLCLVYCQILLSKADTHPRWFKKYCYSVYPDRHHGYRNKTFQWRIKAQVNKSKGTKKSKKDSAELNICVLTSTSVELNINKTVTVRWSTTAVLLWFVTGIVCMFVSQFSPWLLSLAKVQWSLLNSFRTVTPAATVTIQEMCFALVQAKDLKAYSSIRQSPVRQVSVHWLSLRLYCR